MTLSLTCPRCHTAITAGDEDDLVARVQAHVRDDHGGRHTPAREHILARLSRQSLRDAAGTKMCTAPGHRARPATRHPA